MNVVMLKLTFFEEKHVILHKIATRQKNEIEKVPTMYMSNLDEIILYSWQVKAPS